ncbi:glycosyltransferase family 4 protein [Rhodovulum sp. DZ06]|uniref:glycosyltransferase family 4 protein n=1 Tax=Rhodovulum sp. DZ06 TaxID=3425126 RepID=UPI003D3437FC
MTAPIRALLVAEAANPEWVSVPLVGWSLADALRRTDGIEAHIVTQVRNREAFLRAGLVEGEDFTAIDSEAVAKALYKIGQVLRMGEGKGWTTLQALSALGYPYFERLVWDRFGEEIKAGRWDVVHRITPLSPTNVGPLAARVAGAKVPFALGPLNGGVPWPKAFDAERRKEKEWLSYIRGVYKLMPGRGRMLRSCSAIMTGSRHTATEIPRDLRCRTFYIPENGIDPDRFAAPGPRAPHDGPMRGVFIGRMVPYKGPDMLIEAAAPLLRDGRMTLEMIGDGPMQPELKALAERLGVAQAVTFHGWIDHRDVQRIARGCDALTFPSVREFGGGVVLEAMALGLAPVIVDYAGPGELVHDGIGLKSPIGTREEVIAGFARALEQAAADPDALAAMGNAAAAEIAAKFHWARKAEQVRDVYAWMLGRGERPSPFGDPFER